MEAGSIQTKQIWANPVLFFFETDAANWQVQWGWRSGVWLQDCRPRDKLGNFIPWWHWKIQGKDLGEGSRAGGVHQLFGGCCCRSDWHHGNLQRVSQVHKITTYIALITIRYHEFQRMMYMNNPLSFNGMLFEGNLERRGAQNPRPREFSLDDDHYSKYYSRLPIKLLMLLIHNIRFQKPLSTWLSPKYPLRMGFL